MVKRIINIPLFLLFSRNYLAVIAENRYKITLLYNKKLSSFDNAFNHSTVKLYFYVLQGNI